MIYGVRLIGALAVVVAVAGTAHAQVQTGSIFIKVADEQGAVLPGATITISSPVIIAGQMVGTTDETGSYRFPSLLPGQYTVKLELSGFQTVVREGIVVSVG